ncbi:MAG: hypothetical protein GX431_09035 [Bacteroidales bacterium]|jgi:hypothetical protein|nr:hypothetical protein [Bacteroidales bacterium]
MSLNFSNPAPLMFNPLKHYLPYIREFIEANISGSPEKDIKSLTRDIRHLGTCVMDIYTGSLKQADIFNEIVRYLRKNNVLEKDRYMAWTGTDWNDYKILTLSDGSQWMLKYHNHDTHYVHIFPARQSPHTFRVKANTLKSAILYIIVIGKDFVNDDDLNAARALAGLSPVREVSDAEAVTEMIEILRK